MLRHANKKNTTKSGMAVLNPFGSTVTWRYVHDCGDKLLEFVVDDVRCVQRVSMILKYNEKKSVVENTLKESHVTIYEPSPKYSRSIRLYGIRGMSCGRRVVPLI